PSKLKTVRSGCTSTEIESVITGTKHTASGSISGTSSASCSSIPMNGINEVHPARPKNYNRRINGERCRLWYVDKGRKRLIGIMASTKPAFRDPIRFQRCLIPADAFYEWERDGKTKQPFC